MIYSAYSEPAPLPVWMKPLRWWIDINYRLINATALCMTSSGNLIQQVAVAFSRDFTGTCLKGWTVTSVFLASCALRFICGVDCFHFLLSLWPDNALRQPAFRASAWSHEMAYLTGELKSQPMSLYLKLYAGLIILFSMVFLIMAMPYWLVQRPLKKESSRPWSQLIGLSWRIVTVGALYALTYIVLPGMLWFAWLHR